MNYNEVPKRYEKDRKIKVFLARNLTPLYVFETLCIVLLHKLRINLKFPFSFI